MRGSGRVRDGVSDVRADQGFVEDRLDVVVGYELGDRREILRVGLGLRREPGEPDLFEVVGVGEVAEGLVAGDQLPPLAVAEPVAELASSASSSLRSSAALASNVACAGGSSSLSATATASADVGQPHGVEPEVRVGERVARRVILGRGEGQLGSVADLEHLVRRTSARRRRRLLAGTLRGRGPGRHR